ncbi:MAG: CoA transferase [Rhizomicrobium sp.]|jgi:crotonobetainyl-CoA:carnitine CoA-transferase CaiB-like acyl-CoA transferase
MSDRKGPLHGVTVLDLTSFIFGPYATQTLGDLGADVIKIEAPEGDPQRFGQKNLKSGNMSSSFVSLNRNKRSLTLDLKTEEGRAKLRSLVPGAQVFIHNVRADAMSRLGFGYEEVSRLNPSIVYAHCVGFGSDGPYASRMGFDDLVQAASGATDLLARLDGNDMRLLPSYIADKISGLHALYAVLAALFHRERSGEGQFVEIPMLESFTSFLLVEHLFGETFEPPVSHIGNSMALASDRKPLRTMDGHICVQPVSRTQAAKFMELGGIPNAYESERFVTAEGGKAKVLVYYQMMQEAALTKSTEEWMRLGEEHRVAIMRANTLDEVLEDPHLKAVDFFQLRDLPGEGKWRATKPPIKFAKTPASIRLDPPKPGGNNGEF